MARVTKATLRLTFLRRLRQQKEASRRRKSATIRRKVFRLAAYRRARTICCYVALPYEVQTWRMIEAMLKHGKRVVVPVVEPRRNRLQLSEIRHPARDLARGAFGVWEPKPSARRRVPVRDVDLVLVPGLAFDRHGHRLGHGYGYFDRFLARVPRAVPTIGLAYRWQLLDRLPASPHDLAVQTVLTA